MARSRPIRRLLVFVSLACVLAGLRPPLDASAALASGREPLVPSGDAAPATVPGEVIVKLRTSAAAKGVDGLLARHGAKRVAPLFPTTVTRKRATTDSARRAYDGLARFVVVAASSPTTEATSALLADLGRQPEVEYAVPNSL